LHHLHVGVYRWGPIQTPRARIRAAVIACGNDALASHHAALALYGIRPLPEGPVDVTTVGRHVTPRGVRPHTTDALAAGEGRSLHGIALTSPARALLEAAPELTRRELADSVELAQIKRLVGKRELAVAIARAPRRAGVTALRQLVDATRAAFERDRRKTACLTRSRYIVLRTTWTELTQHSHALIARVAEALSAGAQTASPARAGP
jgi:hypothetical protein